MHYIFVYGMLKTDQPSHHLLDNRPAKPAVAPHIALHKGPGYPYATRGRGRTYGEVYQVNDSLLRKLDKFEGVPHEYYREQTPVIVGNRKIMAWIYLSSRACRYPPILSGWWSVNE